uniref:Uncharacterized protein n=1 Tax=Rangifer tarandus platyrhynchus TaxID=3082113 RepID=A0ACB0FGH1_RANTA|nr:unnamed protein product [Rangifer tarandus platyrhynchus]
MTLPPRKRGSGGGLGAKGTGPGPRAEGEAVGARVAEPDRRVAEPDRRVAEPDRRVAEPDRRVAEPDRRVAEPDRRVAEPDRRVAEPDRRVAEPDCFLPGLRPPLGSCDYPRPNAGLGSSQQNKVNITDERARYFQLRFMRQSQNRLTGGGLGGGCCLGKAGAAGALGRTHAAEARSAIRYNAADGYLSLNARYYRLEGVTPEQAGLLTQGDWCPDEKGARCREGPCAGRGRDWAEDPEGCPQHRKLQGAPLRARGEQGPAERRF